MLVDPNPEEDRSSSAITRTVIGVLVALLITSIVCSGALVWAFNQFAGSGCRSTVAQVQTGVAFIHSDRQELDRVASLFATYPGLKSILVRENYIRVDGHTLPVPLPAATAEPLPDDLLIPPTAMLRFVFNEELNHVAAFLRRHGIHNAQGNTQRLTLSWGAWGLSIGGFYIFLERHAGGMPSHGGTQVIGFAIPDWCDSLQKGERRWMHVVDDWYIVSQVF
jgi:hypothetical protein